MKKNNIVFIFGLFIVIYIICLFLPWATFTATTDNQSLRNYEVTTTGLEGIFTLFRIAIPNLFLILLSIISATVVILNTKKLIQIPKIIPILLNVCVILWLISGLYVVLSANGSIYLAFNLMMLTNITSLLLTFLTQ